jgi:hypothetical protein
MEAISLGCLAALAASGVGFISGLSALYFKSSLPLLSYKDKIRF